MPTVADILVGNARVIAALAADGDGADFTAAKLGVVAMLSVLAAQEAERGVAVRLAENAAILAMLDDATADYGAEYGIDATPAAVAEPTIAALDLANAELRCRLIALHEAIEARGDRLRDRAVLALYRRMAEARLLHLPPG